MFKNKIWLGIILSIILLVFSIDGFALYYKYTQESGANFYVSIADKADALENHNEIRQILDDLGNLLVHSKRDGSYPKDESTGGTLSIPNSALALLKAGAKGDILYCSAANVWSKLSIGADNKVLVVSTDVPNWETLTSDLLSDVASVAMLDENEAILGDWTVTGSIGGVDTTEFGYLATISAFGGSIIDDADEATFKATVNLEIGTDVLAYQAIGIANDNLVEIDDADAAVDDYCKLTANGIVGRSYAEVKTDLGIDLSLYYLKTQIDTQGELEVIWGVTLATDSELDALTYSDVGAEQADAGLTSLAGLTYVSPSFIKVIAEDTYAIRTIAEVKSDLSLNLVENTALSTWAGTESITTLGTIATGIWSGTALVIGKLPIAVVSDGDTAHVPTSDNVYDFCETTKNYALNSELHNVLTLGTASGLSLSVQELSLAINSDTSAGAVTSGAGQNQRVWKTDAAGVPGWRMDEGGVEASTFVALSDTPTFYTDQAHKFPRVNAAEDGMEFYTMPGGGDVLGPDTSADNSIVRFDGTNSKTIQDSLATINDTGSINIPLGQKYKINDVNLSYTDVGAIEDAADVIVSSHVDWGSGADQIDTDDVPEGSNNLYQLTGEEVDDYVYALINDAQSVHTLITITYDDPNNAYDFVVTNDLHEYDWTNVVAGDIPDLSAVYQPLDTALTNISALTYVSPSFIKLTAEDTYAVRTIAEVITDLALDSDDLSDVSSIAMLNENEAVTGTWTVTGSIGGVNTTEFGYLADISAFGGSIIDDADEATFKATVNLEIGTDVLAEQTIGIADDNLVEIDDADASVDDYCKLTANGIVGRSYSEVKTDLGIDLTLYYLKTEMDSFSELQSIISDKTLVNVEDGITATAITDDLIVKADFADEDWGDMTVATNVVTIDSGAVTYAKIQNVSATDKILGRSSAGAGVVEEIACTAFGRSIIDDADEATFKATVNLEIGTDVLAEKTIGIADNNLLEVDDTDAADDDYAKFTANGLEGRDASEAKTDLGFMTDLVDDTSPELGGEMDAGAHSIGFTIQTAGGDGTTTIDWTAGNYFKFTHGAMAETFTFDPAPTNPCHLTLIIIQDGTGGRDSTWPVPVKWLGDEPTWTDGGGGKGIVVAMVYDGTSYWSQGTPWEE